MSRLWRDQIRVFLAPGRVDLVRHARGFKPVQTARTTTYCQQSAVAWQSAFQQLEKNLTDASGTDLSVTLSNHFVRYVTLPPQAEIATPEEVKSYANFRMREIYAERMDSWTLSISEWNPMAGAICAAIPRVLMTQLEDMAARHQCKLTEVEPYLTSVYDHWQKLLIGNKIYFVVIEAGRICVAILSNGVWHSIRNQRIAHNVADELLAILDQEAIFFGNKDTVESVHLFAPEHPHLTLPMDCGWNIVPIPTEQIPVPAHYPSVHTDHSEIDQCPA